jgi:hypothetical protein
MNMAEQVENSETSSEQFRRRLTLSLGIGLLLTIIVPSVSIFLPKFLVEMLSLPGLLFCYFLTTYETKPIDDVPLFEAGQYALCGSVSIVLNFPYYSLITYGTLWLFEKGDDEDNKCRT